MTKNAPSRVRLKLHVDVLERLISAKGWTDAEAAKRLGISGGHLSSLKSGRFRPGLKFKLNCELIFGKDVNAVLFEHEVETPAVAEAVA